MSKNTKILELAIARRLEHPEKLSAQDLRHLSTAQCEIERARNEQRDSKKRHDVLNGAIGQAFEVLARVSPSSSPSPSSPPRTNVLPLKGPRDASS